MTLNGVIALTFTEFGSFWSGLHKSDQNYTNTSYSKNVGQRDNLKNLVFSDISFMAILAGDHPSESVKVRHSPLASKNLTITWKSWKRCKIGRGKLVLITNRKSYMSFRLAPNSVTLDDLERVIAISGS